MAKTQIAPNLFILERGNNRYYVARISVNGKQVDRSLGNVNATTLREAKTKLNQLLTFGPEEKVVKTKAITLNDIIDKATDAIALIKQWRSPISRRQFEQNFRDYVLPVIGDMNIEDIDTKAVLKVLQPIWFEKTETASRVRMRIEAVFAWLIHEGLRKNPVNPAMWSNALEFDLPSKAKIKSEKHHEAMTVDETRQAVAYCIAHPSPVNAAILFGIATCTRLNEFLPAHWDEIDMKHGVWSVPPERRKDGREFPHRVPLSTLAKKAIAMAAPEGNLFVWKGEVISRDSPRAKLRDIIKRPVTMHGCRSTFRDWCAVNGVDHATAEKALSHKWGNEVTNAYLREDLLEKRRELMQQWADELLG